MRTVLNLVAISLALASAVQAQDVFVTSGWDYSGGFFEGRITVDPHATDAGAVLVSRERSFDDGTTERLQGRGRRSGNWIRAVFPRPTVGMLDRLEGRDAEGPSTVMQIKQERGGGVWTESFTAGERTSLSRGRPLETPPSPAAPPSGEGPALHRAQVEHANDSDFVERDLTTDEEPGVDETHATALKSFPSALFIRGEDDEHKVAPNDVAQGRLGNCYLLAALIATARTDPDTIVSMIDSNDDGTYTVRLKGLGPFRRGAVVRVSDAIPVSGGGQAPAFVGFGDSEILDGERVREIWPSVIEKAWAKYKGGYARTGDFYSATAFSFIGGGSTEGYDPRDMTAEEILAVLREADREGYPMTLGTNTPKDIGEGAPGEMSRLNLHGYHAYAFMGLEGDRVRLYNPWGHSHPVRALTMAQVKRLFASMSLGRY